MLKFRKFKIALTASLVFVLAFTFGCEEKSTDKAKGSPESMTEEVAEPVIAEEADSDEGHEEMDEEAEKIAVEAEKAAELAEKEAAAGYIKMEKEKALKEGRIFTDNRDGKKYRWIKIGTQTWIAENLNYEANGSKCYDDNPANCAIYGRLYNWETAKTACPNGWHLPSNAEWDILMKSVEPSCSTKATCDNAGKLLKATSGWVRVDNKGIDTVGFSALPGGYNRFADNFYYAGYYGYWWSASEYNSSDAYRVNMVHDRDCAYYNDYDKSSLLSVRCLQN